MASRILHPFVLARVAFLSGLLLSAASLTEDKFISGGKGREKLDGWRDREKNNRPEENHASSIRGFLKVVWTRSSLGVAPKLLCRVLLASKLLCSFQPLHLGWVYARRKFRATNANDASVWELVRENCYGKQN